MKYKKTYLNSSLFSVYCIPSKNNMHTISEGSTYHSSDEFTDKSSPSFLLNDLSQINITKVQHKENEIVEKDVKREVIAYRIGKLVISKNSAFTINKKFESHIKKIYSYDIITTPINSINNIDLKSNTKQLNNHYYQNYNSSITEHPNKKAKYQLISI